MALSYILQAHLGSTAVTTNAGATKKTPPPKSISRLPLKRKRQEFSSAWLLADCAGRGVSQGLEKQGRMKN